MTVFFRFSLLGFQKSQTLVFPPTLLAGFSLSLASSSFPGRTQCSGEQALGSPGLKDSPATAESSGLLELGGEHMGDRVLLYFCLCLAFAI